MSVLSSDALAAAIIAGSAGYEDDYFDTMRASNLEDREREALRDLFLRKGLITSTGVDLDLSGNLQVDGTADIAGNVTIEGTTSLNGDVTVEAGQEFTADNAFITQHTTVKTADGAITVASGIVYIEKTSAAAMTVAAPSSQDGTRITIIGNTDFAHVITFTGGTLLDGTTGANTTATFAAFKGASITVVARGAFWLVESFNACTIAP